MSAAGTPSSVRRAAVVAGVLLLAALVLAVPTGAGSAVAAPTTPTAPTARAATGQSDAFTETKTLTRTFTDAQGAVETVSSYDVTVRADQTSDLRGRQRIRVSWSGAQPSGGRASNPYGERGLQQEYPVVVLQCRGRDDARLPLAQQVRPETCWTSSSFQRTQDLVDESQAVWVDDAYATDEDKARVSGLDPVPAEDCPAVAASQISYSHITAFVPASGDTFSACTADTMPPEAAVGGAFPPAEIAGFTDLDGNGSVQFEVRSDVENESLGCNRSTACSVVVIPIVGLSCQAPSSPASLADQACRRTGRFPAGSSNFVPDGIDAAVGPALWWSESNWRNRFSIPVSFGLPPDACDVLDSRAPVGFYGSELLAQAALQWSPAYCLNKQRFKFQHNQMSDAQGFNLMESGLGAAAVVSSQRETDPGTLVGYAPTAVTGFSVGYVVDRPGNAGDYTSLRLNARLLVKLLTQSYLGSAIGRDHPGGIADNPLAMMADPEFEELNPRLSTSAQEAGATILSLSNDSDVIQQLTEYIAQDADAMAFVRGRPDPWGMRINPSYQDIALPTGEWPLLDTFVPTFRDECRAANPTVYFSAIAAPVTTMRKISEALLDAWPNVQTRCEVVDPDKKLFRLTRVERQAYGSRFMLGITSLGDAARYGLRSAALQTRPGTYVAPTQASLSAAIALTEQRRPRLPFVLDQADVARSRTAYPGTMVLYTAAKLRDLPQETADEVAQFIRVSTTEGQRPGGGNGELPGGFLPIRATGPTAKLLASARAVADAVEAQTPAPTDDEPTPDPEPTDEPTPDAPPPTTDDTGAGGDLTPPPADDVPTEAPTDEASAPPVTTDETEAMSATTVTRSGMAGRLLPVLLGAGLLGLLCSAGLRFFVRPPRRLG